MPLDLDKLDGILAHVQASKDRVKIAKSQQRAGKLRKSGRYGIACKIAAREPLACAFNQANGSPPVVNGGKRWFRKQ